MPTAAVGMAPAAEEDEEPLLEELEEPELPDADAAADEVPSEACETTELFAD